MRHHNEDFVQFHENVSVRILCAVKFIPFLKGQKDENCKNVDNFGIGADFNYEMVIVVNW